MSGLIIRNKNGKTHFGYFVSNETKVITACGRTWKAGMHISSECDITWGAVFSGALYNEITCGHLGCKQIREL